MKQNLKNPLATGQAATVQPGRADPDFDAAKYTPAPRQPRPVPNQQWTHPAVGNPNVDSGLGLSVVRAIVNAHGGRIELRSDVGKGSSFSVHLANH